MLTKEQLLDYEVPWLEKDEEVEGVKIISREIIGNSRWTQTVKTIFNYENKYYKILSDHPSTEMQEVDWSYWNPCLEEVFPVEVIVTKYVTQKELENLK